MHNQFVMNYSSRVAFTWRLTQQSQCTSGVSSGPSVGVDSWCIQLSYEHDGQGLNRGRCKVFLLAFLEELCLGTNTPFTMQVLGTPFSEAEQLESYFTQPPLFTL